MECISPDVNINLEAPPLPRSSAHLPRSRPQACCCQNTKSTSQLRRGVEVVTIYVHLRRPYVHIYISYMYTYIPYYQPGILGFWYLGSCRIRIISGRNRQVHVGRACRQTQNSKRVKSKWGFPKIRGPLFGSAYNKSPTILGSILGPMIFGISQVDVLTDES